ncbi:MAG TPA: TonB family protein [Bacteroidia bacterium]|nr:TonB family protein [Bacteroidia bacterium]
MKPLMSKDTIFTEGWINMVFENLNQKYGAFLLRRIYRRTLGNAIIITVLIFFGAFIIPTVLSKLFGGAEDENRMVTANEVTLAEPPPIDKNEPPPPPVEPPPPLKNTIKFTPPVVVKDEEVQEEPPPSQDLLQDAEAGTKTEEGDTSGVDYSLLEGNDVVEQPDQVFTIVEQMPTFPGGEGELRNYLQKNVKYPPFARENGITGTVYLQFIIGKDGSVSDVKLLRGIGGGCDEEAIRVVKAMPPWKAGKQSGNPVTVMFNLPVKFSLK